MKAPAPAGDVLWEEQQRAYKAQANFDRREWMKSFALVLALVLITLAAAAGLAGLVKTP